jgi:hypothetical protein
MEFFTDLHLSSKHLLGFGKDSPDGALGPPEFGADLGDREATNLIKDQDYSMVPWKGEQGFMNSRDGLLFGLSNQCTSQATGIPVVQPCAMDGPSARRPIEINDLTANDALDPSSQRTLCTIQIALDLIHGCGQNILRNILAVLGRDSVSPGQPFNPAAELRHEGFDSLGVTLPDAQSERAVVCCARHVASLDWSVGTCKFYHIGKTCDVAHHLRRRRMYAANPCSVNGGARVREVAADVPEVQKSDCGQKAASA